jgi:hypothetical protein
MGLEVTQILVRLQPVFHAQYPWVPHGIYELIKNIGVALGEEAQAKDVDVLLGPTINIHRHPLGEEDTLKVSLKIHF